jgi:hypothetical protein
MPLFEFKRRSTRRRWIFIGSGTTLVAAMLLIVAAATANLPGSTFESTDGNLIVNTSGNEDWVNAPNRVRGDDLPSGTNDNSFGQGSKEDDPNVTVVTGSIPPQKSDLTRFYVASEVVGTGASAKTFLYLAWERSNVLGSANMDFEINKLAQPNLTTTGPKTLNRSPGDLLITFDFGGSGNPTLGLLKWVTTGATSQCFSSNSLPCWGNRVNLTAAGFADGAVNSTTVTDPIANVSLPAGTFGEAAVNMTAAGIFPAGQCAAFGSAFLKSRSSASFPAEVKDFVAPQPVNISNCGKIIIRKVTENGDATFGYTTTGGLNPSTFNLSNGQSRTYSDSTQVQPGNYSVTESTLPAGWTLKSLSCTSTGSGTSSSTSGATANITMAADGVVDCTYTNHINLKPTIATTLSDESIEVGGSVHDSATLTGASANAGGTVTYTVYTDSACSQGAQSAGTKTVTNGVVPDSDPVTFNSTGDFYWQAVYSGDADNDGATSVCTSEHLVVTQKHPSIATTLSADTIQVGGSVHDSATLTGATANAGGSVTYTVYTDSACSQGAQSAGTKTVTNGVVPDSDPVTFNTAGDYYWQAVYSGDANNAGATSVCTSEHLVVTKRSPGISTAQNLIPNDDATISGAFNATGTITFSLFSPSAPTCSGTPAYTETVTVSGNGTYNTTNTSFIASTEGTWRWRVSYSGDANNDPATSACGVERFTIANS